MDEQEQIPEKPTFFQRLTSIPCFKETLKNGFQCWIASHLGWLLATSNGVMASKVGVRTFIVVSAATWTYCRYTTGIDRKQREELNRAIEQMSLYKVEENDGNATNSAEKS